MKKEIKDMLEHSIIELSSSKWSAPIVIVPKKDKSLRICVDYRRLNSISEMDAYPMPRIDEVIDRLGAATFISTMNLNSKFLCWWKPKPRLHLLHHLVCVMPFGLQGAPATFQRIMDKVIKDWNISQ